MTDPGVFSLPPALARWAGEQRGCATQLPLAVIRVAGADAREFLNGQLTIDLRKPQAGCCRPAAWCTPQGRVWASLRVVDRGDDFLLLVPVELADAFITRMRMFVLRAKVELEPLEARVDGWVGPDAPADAAIAIGGNRCLLIDADAARPAQAGLAHAHWSALALLAGEIPICGETQEAWLPQMLNLDLIGGLDFNKGCYPGQEPIARVHYRGSVKRRAVLLVDAPPGTAVGDPVLCASGDKAGEILALARAGESDIAAAVIATQIFGEDVLLVGETPTGRLVPRLAD